MKTTLFIYISLISISIMGFGDEWSLVKDRNNIKVYVRQLKTGDFKDVRIVGNVKAGLNEVVASLEDVDGHKLWVKNTIESKFVSQQSPDNFHYYISTDMPFPIQDRDVVVHYKREQDPITKVVKTSSVAVPDMIPVKQTFVRIPEFTSTYTLTPVSKTETKIEYFLRIDPGGILPAWLVNLAIATGSIETMESLFDILQSGKYSHVSVANLTDY